MVEYFLLACCRNLVSGRSRHGVSSSSSVPSTTDLSCPSSGMGHELVMVDLACLQDATSDLFGGLGCGAGGRRFCRFCGGTRWKPCTWGRMTPRTDEEKGEERTNLKTTFNMASTELPLAFQSW